MGDRPGATTPTSWSWPPSAPTATALAPDPTRHGRECRDVVLTSGPWWSFPNTAVMSKRPTFLALDEQSSLDGDAGPAIQCADGHHVWASAGPHSHRTSDRHRTMNALRRSR
ncbi:DUF6745 domain-containing protein [Micromonospora arborensis]|uniref:DUF6745 domain-containing protein n=1 Tax=Micromonospora arborensis TaxID=2116518 RepID=UPI00340E42EE